MSDKITIGGREFDTDSNGNPVAYHDLPRDHLPMLVRWLKEEPDKGLGQGEMVAWHIVTGIDIMPVPGFGNSDFTVSTSIQTANGLATLTTSDGLEYCADLEQDQLAALHEIAESVESGRVKNGQMPPWEEAGD